MLEDYIQQLVHEHPAVLPIAEIDPIYEGAVPICREFATPVGNIDNFLVTPSGLPVLVECKLWRNAQARREVVGQILDYAKELALFTAADVEREAARQHGGGPDTLLEMMRAVAPDLDDVQFHDSLTANLRRGRFLLLIVGEGIHERVELIASYLQAHAGLHFTFGLVELPIYRLPEGGRLVAPRVLARTELITRNVVAVPDGHAVEAERDAELTAEVDPQTVALGDERQAFWEGYLKHLRLDDREQPIPKAPRMGYMALTLPAPGGTSWLTVYRDVRNSEVGVFLSSHRDTPGERAMEAVAAEWETLRPLLGGSARLDQKQGRPRIVDSKRVRSLADPSERERAYEWLAERTNTFVNVLRPRVRSAVADERATSG